MESNKTRSRLMFALGAAILVGAILLMVLNATGGVSAVGPPPPSQGPAGQLAPTRPPPLKPPPPRTGGILPPVDLSHLKGDRMPEGVSAAALLSKWDWREQGKVTSVKHQGDCGSCYAFAAIGNIESKLLIDGAGTYDFSENNAKECNWYERSCSGGNYFMLANLFSKKGTVLESCDPYVPSDVDCNDTCPYEKTLLDWRIIAGSVPDTDVLKAYIQLYGPIYTFVYAGSGDAWATEFGIYDGSYTLHYPGTEGVNHLVLIVGWDDSLTHAGGTGGWIVKNSWGTDWGGTCGYGTERGYFTIAYGSASIGTGSSFMYAWQDYDPNGDIMYYDEAGWSNAWGCGTTTAWGMVKFIPTSDTNVTRVEFWTTDVTTDVDVYIYDDFDGTALSNLLWSSLDHSFAEAGYHGVVVDPHLPVTNGDDVIAVVKFTNVSLQYPIPIDVDGPHETGRTYASPDGSIWTDLGAAAGYDVAIRLRTSGMAPTPTPQLLQNPGFETGSWDPWQIWGSSSLTSDVSHNGSWSAHMGNYNDAHDEVFQWVDIPGDATNVTIDFWAQLRTDETFAEVDYFLYSIWDQTWTTPYIARGFDLGLTGDVDWAEEIYSLTPDELADVAGQTVAFVLMVVTNDSLPSRVWVDDLGLYVTTPTPTPTPTATPPTVTPTPTPTTTPDGIGHRVYLPIVLKNYDPSELLRNGNFDTGTLTPWRTIIGSPELDDQVYQSPYYSARLASRNDAEDIIDQVVTVPSNATEVTLDFWYRVSSDDPSSPEDHMCAGILDTEGNLIGDNFVCYDLYYVEPKDQWLPSQLVISGTDLTPLKGQTVLVSFQGWTNATNPSTIWVDDVSFKVTGVGP